MLVQSSPRQSQPMPNGADGQGSTGHYAQRRIRQRVNPFRMHIFGKQRIDEIVGVFEFSFSIASGHRFLPPCDISGGRLLFFQSEFNLLLHIMHLFRSDRPPRILFAKKFRIHDSFIATSPQKMRGTLTFKVHLDGYNIIPYVTGAVKESPRNHIIYFSDDGAVMAVRVGDYKFNLAVQPANRMMVWAEPLVKLRLPLIYNLRRDPFERADLNSNTYFDWMVDHVPQLYLMQATVAAEIENFVKYPPRQKPASFNLDAVLAMVSNHGGHV